MGLGKTIQSIAFLQEVYNVSIRGPFLVIAPLSTITNWEREFNTWTELNTIVYHGSLASRQMIQQYEMYCKDARVSGGVFSRVTQRSPERPWGFQNLLEASRTFLKSQEVAQEGFLKEFFRVLEGSSGFKRFFKRFLKRFFRISGGSSRAFSRGFFRS